MKRLMRCILGILMMTLVLSGFSRGPQSETMKDKLLALAGVVSVEEIKENQSSWMPEKYMVIFEQQLDWNNPEAGTFKQRVEVGLHPDANVTVMETAGYFIEDDILDVDDQIPLCKILNANFIKVEHRYIGKSYPENLANTSTDGWQYATVENEAGDYHHIFEALSTVIDGKWVCTGTSRGGRACLDYARLYPEDNFAGYVPYVGVNPKSDHDSGMIDFLYTEVGNKAFGHKQAAQMRQTILDFQVELIKNKEVLAPRLWKYLQKSNMTFNDEMTDSRSYDMAVLEFLANFWMQAGDIEEVEKVLAMPDTPKDKKLEAEYNLLLDYSDSSGYSFQSNVWPYYFSALLEEGNCEYNFSYLYDALKKIGCEGLLDKSDRDAENYLRNFALTDDQRKTYSFKPGHYEALDSWVKGTDKQIIFIGGDLDPWYPLYIDGEGNPNFHKYILSGKTHNVQISNFDEQTQNEITEIMKSWVE